MKFISAMKAERAVAQLLAAPDVHSADAQKALRTLLKAGAGAIPTLIEAFATADRHQTVGIVDALAANITDRNFDIVVEGLGHTNERCVAGTARALSAANNYNPSKLLKTILDDDVSKHAVLDVLRAHLDKINIRELLAVAYKVEAREKSAVFKMIGEKADADLVPELLSRLGGRDHAARVHIIQILGAYDLPEVVLALEESLKDGNRLIRASALEALGNMPTFRNVELVCTLLMDPDLEVQGKAVDLAIKLHHPETCKFLVPVLQDESEYTRRSAVEVLNELADSESIKYLLVAIGDGDWWVRSRACDALAKIGGPKVLAAVMQLINDKDENIRRSAIEILNQTKDEAAVAHLIEATRDSDWWVCERAIDALAAIGNRDAVPRLLEMLDGNPKTIPSVVNALGELGDTEILPNLLAMLQRQEPNIQTSAIKAAAQLTREINHQTVIQQIQPLLKATDEKVAKSAREALEGLQERFTESVILADQKAQQLAEPKHTLLKDEATIQDAAAPAEANSKIDITQLNPGDLIESRYKYVEKIGKGAFGTVILVEDTVVGESLILKFLNANVADDEEMLQRFVS